MTRTAHSGVLTAAAGVLVAVGMLLLIMVALVDSAGAAFPGKNGKIAYTGWDGHDREIYTIKASGGGGGVKVTDNGTADSNPDYSPDGQTVAFSGSDGHDREIYTIKPGEEGRVKVTDNGTADFSPSWGSRP